MVCIPHMGMSKAHTRFCCMLEICQIVRICFFGATGGASFECTDHMQSCRFSYHIGDIGDGNKHDDTYYYIYLPELVSLTATNIQNDISILPKNETDIIIRCLGTEEVVTLEGSALRPTLHPLLLRNNRSHTLTIDTSDFLYYIQQICLCENSVVISSAGPNHLSMKSHGELMCMEIERGHTICDTTTIPQVKCCVKIMRSLLPIIGKTIVLCLQDSKYAHVTIDKSTTATFLHIP